MMVWGNTQKHTYIHIYIYTVQHNNSMTPPPTVRVCRAKLFEKVGPLMILSCKLSGFKDLIPFIEATAFTRRIHSSRDRGKS